jgi:glycosyltransferase involved in cell wall biosynthesis
MVDIRKLRIAYLSTGNIPSFHTHNIQTMKMSEGLFDVASEFCLLTSSTHLKNEEQSKFIHNWYGTKAFPITFIPSEEETSQGMFSCFSANGFIENSIPFLKEWKPDIIMTRDILGAYHYLKEKFNVVIESHIRHTHEYFQYLNFFQKYDQLLSVVTLCQHLRLAYTHEGISPNLLQVLPHGVDDNFEGFHSKSSLGIPNNRFIVTYTGHLYERKGIDLILRTAQLLPEVSFYILGGANSDQLFWKYCNQYLNNNNVHFLGMIEPKKIPSYLNASDVLLLPNKTNDAEAGISCPLKLFEYMQAKKPIICSETKYLKSYLSHNENSLIVPDTPKYFYDAIVSLKNSSQLREKLAQNAWEKVKTFTWKQRAIEILEFATSKQLNFQTSSN